MEDKKQYYHGYIQLLSIRVLAIFGLSGNFILWFVIGVRGFIDSAYIASGVSLIGQILPPLCFARYFRYYCITNEAIFFSNTIFPFRMKQYFWKDIIAIQKRYLWFDNYGKSDAKEKTLAIIIFTKQGNPPEEYVDLDYFQEIKWDYMSTRNHILCLMYNQEIFDYLEKKTNILH